MGIGHYELVQAGLAARHRGSPPWRGRRQGAGQQIHEARAASTPTACCWRAGIGHDELVQAGLAARHRSSLPWRGRRRQADHGSARRGRAGGLLRIGTH
ncbi:hypothetical protein CEK28_08885 [Xenophilus sp. AP218F]|nr:hypothetical protein CEK28_08885 [Xenophilus sp. AP218F]